jgi:hypothetical protein
MDFSIHHSNDIFNKLSMIILLQEEVSVDNSKVGRDVKKTEKNLS